MSRKVYLFVMFFVLTLWGLQKASSKGYLSEFDAPPENLNLSVRAYNTTLTVEWTLKGGELVRTLARGRDAVILIYPGWIREKEDDVGFSIADVSNVSVILGDRKVEFNVMYHPYNIIVSNGSKNGEIWVVDVPFDFPSTVKSGKIELRFSTYHTCNNITVGVIYFHSTGRGQYHDLVLPMSIDLGEGFPMFPNFRSEFNFTIDSSKMQHFLSSAVNAHYLVDWIDEPRGWLSVKTVNVRVCPPKTS
ncbi:hypothetical protein [Thermococcus gorgonarius]|uniref:Uncharacterized protein n=1 Tax=Thermococcus gorgonarius TaxID=71997 RepID=A0A2Z2M3I1_THEGO|nr:hypothetical protein [Thermococcus gorgonarius]ASJ00230.1 hypothetical protein A3K92_01405 [Thermococcus gorgonarius]